MSELVFNHKPVLFQETIESLNIDPAGTYIDGTAGGGGHSGGGSGVHTSSSGGSHGGGVGRGF